jgi:hypothetical protein
MRRFRKYSSLSLLSIFVLWVQHLTICDRALLFPFVNSLLVFSLNNAVELKKQISCALQLTNKTDEQVAFKVNKHSSKKGRSTLQFRENAVSGTYYCSIGFVG